MPTLTEPAFRRWLRAHRPPMAMFLGMSELEQEQLALIGDEHTQDVAIAFGYAVSNPQAADAGMSAAQGNLDAEESIARRVASSLVQKILGGRPAAPAAPPKFTVPDETLAGFGSRRVATTQRTDAAAPRSFLGRPPDAKPEAPKP